MNQPLYDIYFTGQLVEGTDIATGKANLAKLFKASPENVQKFFNGKPHLLKRAVDKPAALKYKAALHKAGLLVAFKAHQSSVSTPTATTATAAHTTKPDNQREPALSLAPVGTEVLTASERPSIKTQEIDTSAIKMVSAFMDPTPEQKTIPPAPDTRHMSIAAAGSDLLTDQPETPQPPPVDTSAITLAPAGTELEELHDKATPLNPDTSKLSIAPPGSDLREGQPPSPTKPAPNTEHIRLAKD